MLEHQQLQLVSGLQELYRRLQQGQGWSGAPLPEAANGSPLTHDILERLGALQQDLPGGSTDFTEDFNAMQSILLSKGSGLMQRQTSFDTISEMDSPLFEPMQKAPNFTNPFAQHFPPTPPNQSPHPTFVKTSSPLKTQSFVTSDFSDASWQMDPNDMNMDFTTYDTSMMDIHAQGLAIAQAQMFQNAAGSINPSQLMRPWNTAGTSQSFYEGGLYT